MKNLVYLFTFTLLLAACKKSETTSAQTAVATNYGSSCLIGKWSDSSLPVRIKLSKDFDNDFIGVPEVNNLNKLEQMAKVWNDAVPSKTLISVPFPEAASLGYSSTSSFRDSEIGIYKSFNWFSNVGSSALAITQFYGVITSSSGLGTYVQLTHADIMLNYRDYGPDFTMTNNPLREYDVPTVVLHELGHLLGLCHETEEPSIMAPYYLTTQHAIQQYDKDIIDYIYVGSASALSAKKNTNTNALSIPAGTEVSGMIELHADGQCVHYLNGKKTFEHRVENFKKHK